MSEKIDINVADADSLATISGIGAALAERIIEYRETVHPFEEVIELAAVPGISEKMVRSFEDFVTVQPALRITAVPLNLDEPEDIPLLAAPESVELLAAPSEPEGLLAAELPEPEEIMEEDTAEAADSEPTVASAPAEEAEASPTVEEPTFYTEFEEAEVVPTTAVPPPPASDWEAKAQRRGCINTLLGATFGAILGAVLTLAILAAINNGRLNYAYSDTQLQQQLDTEIISRTNELNELTTRISLAVTEEAAANQSLQSDFSATSEALNESIANNEEVVSYLATRSGDLELRLQEVAGAAETFTGFLDGLRLLLDDLDEATATMTPTPFAGTVSPTPTATPFSSNEPLPSATVTSQPTRTPQPTATPFTFATNTPAAQP